MPLWGTHQGRRKFMKNVILQAIIVSTIVFFMGLLFSSIFLGYDQKNRAKAIKVTPHQIIEKIQQNYNSARTANG